MNTFRVEPAVANDFKFAVLFQTGVFVVDDIDQFLVVADDAEFSCWDVNIVEGNAVEG